MGEFQFIAFAELVFILEILLSDVEFTGLYYIHVGEKKSIEAAVFFPFMFLF